MKVFKDYADFYDLLYKEKPYQAESDFIHSRIQGYSPEAKTIVEFGSGSGKHAFFLGQLGYSVMGIDQSKKMVTKANQLIESVTKPKISFMTGDIGTKKLPGKFDAGISLFHVMSYQTQTKDFLRTLKNMWRHLKPGGVFLFDTWYGPAVLSDPPTIRHRRLTGPGIEVLRLSQPELLLNENRVDVHYELWIKDLSNSTVKTVHETHSMRYFFKPEMEMLLEMSGFSLVSSEEFLSGSRLSDKTWGSLWIARKTRTASRC